MVSLNDKVSALEQPESFFHGKCRISPPSPREITLFSRKDLANLNYENKPHFHHRCILLASLKGRGRVILDQRMIELDMDQLILIQPFQNHYFQADDDFLWLFIGFEMDNLSLLSSLKDAPQPVTVDSRLLLEEIIELWNHKHSSITEEALISQALGTLLYHMACWSEESQSDTMVPVTGRDARFIRQVQNYVYSCLETPMTVKTMAEEMGYSESGLRKRFKSALGFSPALYLKQMKMGRAASLLANTRLTVSEIAERCGYDSLFSFSRSFKQSLGKSPREYRRHYYV